ncbi:MAG: c-type cytochrome [Pirellula sp.]
MRTLHLLLCLILCCSNDSVSRGEEPFVAGFDRFHVPASNDSMAGNLLLAELNCTACHSAGKELKPKGGPNLLGAGNRLHREWIANYLRSPSSEKSGGTMPHMLHQVPESDREKAIQALVAFLSTEPAEEPKIVASGGSPVAHEFWLKGDTSRGRTLYHQIGCIACHAIDESFQTSKKIPSDLERKIASLDLEADELEEMGLALPKEIRPIPMSRIEAKYTLRSLSMYLIAPHLVRPGGRMPSLELQPHEAADIASYLMRESKASPTQATESSVEEDALVQQGEMLFGKLACANCHASSDTKPIRSKSLDELDVDAPRGCLSENPAGPIYGLSERQKKAIHTSITASQLKKHSPESSVQKLGDDLTFLMMQLNCYACHERNGRGGAGPRQWPFFENTQQIDIGDEGRMPPSLDHVGRKLQSSWLQKVLEGKGDVRPHFRVRMPVFQEHAKSLATFFADVDQVPDTKPLDTKASQSKPENTAKVLDLEAGRSVMDSGCVQCHTFRSESLPGTIGIDIANVEDRIHREWFEAFLLNPVSLKKNTRMPSFFPDGKSSVPHVLDGHVPSQLKSLWGYLNSKETPLPNKLEQSRSQLFELVPKGAPIVLRTFMESQSAGTFAIAVGFPGQHHFAFDAKSMRLAEAWKGKFLNAQGTWFDRFAPPAIPLGTDRILFPRSSYYVRSNEDLFVPVELSQMQFRGYTLDAHDVPVFRYTVEKNVIEDTIQSKAINRLVRKIKVAEALTSISKSDVVWLLVSDQVVRMEKDIVWTLSNLKVNLSATSERKLIPHDGRSDLFIMLPTNAAVEVGYQW